MLFQVLCGFEPIFYTTHPNEEPFFLAHNLEVGDIKNAAEIYAKNTVI